MVEAEHDLVVLSVGLLPVPEICHVFKGENLELDEFSYIKQVEADISPAKTSIKGVFVAGAASGPKDIPDSIIQAGSAAAEASAYLKQMKKE